MDSSDDLSDHREVTSKVIAYPATADHSSAADHCTALDHRYLISESNIHHPGAGAGAEEDNTLSVTH